MAWGLLILGGCFEVGFTTCLRFVDGFRSLPWTLGFLVSVAISMTLLEIASRTIPMGTAYAVWGGIGALGTVIVGIWWFGEAASPMRLVLLLGLIACIVGLRLVGKLMAFDAGLVEWVREALAPAGDVTLRKMMGGATLYCDGTIFAIVVEDEIWIKGDAETDAVWDAAGCEKFSVTFKDGFVDVMNYRRAPTDVYDDADAMREWTALGIAAGARRKVKKPKAKK